MQLAALVRRVEKIDCSKERLKKALKELLNRFLAETSFNHNDKRVLGQHNLVRSVALESHRNLIQKLPAKIQLELQAEMQLELQAEMQSV